MRGQCVLTQPRALSEAQRLGKARQALSKVRYFSELPRPVLEALAGAAVQRLYAAGQVNYLEGEPANELDILETDWMKATRMSVEGRKQSLLVLRTGEVFGDRAVLICTSYPGTVTVLEAVEAWAIEPSVILGLIERHP